MPLAGQSGVGLCHRISASLAAAGIELEPELLAGFDGEQILPYDIEAIGRFRRVINWVDAAFKTFKGELREETSPVQIFGHHLDLAINWFSGRLVPGVDPADEEKADENLNFGFVTGDSSIPDAYFFATAYPEPDKWTDLAFLKALTGTPTAGPARYCPMLLWWRSTSRLRCYSTICGRCNLTGRG